MNELKLCKDYISNHENQPTMNVEFDFEKQHEQIQAHWLKRQKYIITQMQINQQTKLLIDNSTRENKKKVDDLFAKSDNVEH